MKQFAKLSVVVAALAICGQAFAMQNIGVDGGKVTMRPGETLNIGSPNGQIHKQANLNYCVMVKADSNEGAEVNGSAKITMNMGPGNMGASQGTDVTKAIMSATLNGQVMKRYDTQNTDFNFSFPLSLQTPDTGNDNDYWSLQMEFSNLKTQDTNQKPGQIWVKVKSGGC